jgi:hypothetical protein
VKSKCYFCDSELIVVSHTFKIALKEEPVCEECFLKTVNRTRAKQQDES